MICLARALNFSPGPRAGADWLVYNLRGNWSRWPVRPPHGRPASCLVPGRDLANVPREGTANDGRSGERLQATAPRHALEGGRTARHGPATSLPRGTFRFVLRLKACRPAYAIAVHSRGLPGLGTVCSPRHASGEFRPFGPLRAGEARFVWLHFLNVTGPIQVVRTCLTSVSQSLQKA